MVTVFFVGLAKSLVDAGAKIYIFTGWCMLVCPFQVKTISPFVWWDLPIKGGQRL